MAPSNRKHAATRVALPDRALTARFRRRLLHWYRRHRRVLPWRAVGEQRANAYHVLVSEAMLQQTQVATVIDYFNRFIAALPTIEALASADEQRVLRLWQGLGYYRRARHLHAAAKLIVRDYGGRVPDTVVALLTLPGVGRYTAGAIASIAYDRRAPLVDGNVARVLARWFAIDRPIDGPAARDRLWSLAAHLTPPSKPGDFNQAMMELGALVCAPQSPRCVACPVATLCRANKEGRAGQLPVAVKRRAPKPVRHHVLAIERAGRFLLQQRPAQGLWSSMWQLPTIEHLASEVDAGELSRWVEAQLGLRIDPPRQVDVFVHPTTHRRIEFVIWRATVRAGRLRNGSGVWRRRENVTDLPLANPQIRAIAGLSTPA